MLDCMERKQKKDFTPMNKFKEIKPFILAMLCIISLVQLQNCGKNPRNTLINTGPVNITIDLNLPKYNHLRYAGEFAYFDGGIKGVLVIHDFDDAWYAFERTCAYEPENVCNQILIDSNELAMRCGSTKNNKFEPCCNSLYNFAGFPTRGPANAPLARYNISRFGNTVSIYN